MAAANEMKYTFNLIPRKGTYFHREYVFIFPSIVASVLILNLVSFITSFPVILRLDRDQPDLVCLLVLFLYCPLKNDIYTKLIPQWD